MQYLIYVCIYFIFIIVAGGSSEYQSGPKSRDISILAVDQALWSLFLIFAELYLCLYRLAFKNVVYLLIFLFILSFLCQKRCFHSIFSLILISLIKMKSIP